MRKPAMWFQNRFNTNQAVQAEKMGRGWIFLEKTKVLISFAATVKPICVFVFICADPWFSSCAADHM